MKNEEIEDSYLIINALANRIEGEIGVLNTLIIKDLEGGQTDQDLYLNILVCSEHIIIQVCSFLDEWKRLNYLIGQNIFKDRILKITQVTKPATDIIKQRYKGINDYRNKLLAHNYRIDSLQNKNALRGDYISNLKIPTSIHDFFLIRDCLIICKKVFNKEFKEFEMLPSDFIKQNSQLPTLIGLKESEYKQLIGELTKTIEIAYKSYSTK